MNYVLESIECFRYGLSITGRYSIEGINGELYGIAFSAEDEKEQNIRWLMFDYRKNVERCSVTFDEFIWA